MRIASAFALATLFAFIAGGAVAIFGFDYFEKAWGRWNSLQVYAMLALPLAAVSGVGAWFGARALPIGVVLPARRLVVPAVLFSIFANAAVWLGSSHINVFLLGLVVAISAALLVFFWFNPKGISHAAG
mgnify:FL=1